MGIFVLFVDVELIIWDIVEGFLKVSIMFLYFVFEISELGFVFFECLVGFRGDDFIDLFCDCLLLCCCLVEYLIIGDW